MRILTQHAGLALALVALSGTPALAQNHMHRTPSAPMVGGQAMWPARDLIDNAVNPADHTTLVAAVKAADLVERRHPRHRPRAASRLKWRGQLTMVSWSPPPGSTARSG